MSVAGITTLRLRMGTVRNSSPTLRRGALRRRRPALRRPFRVMIQSTVSCFAHCLPALPLSLTCKTSCRFRMLMATKDLSMDWRPKPPDAKARCRMALGRELPRTPPTPLSLEQKQTLNAWSASANSSTSLLGHEWCRVAYSPNEPWSLAEVEEGSGQGEV